MLHIHAVRGLGPEAKDEQPVDDRRYGERKVVIFEPFRAEPQKKNPRDRRNEDAKGDSRVVKEP